MLISGFSFLRESGETFSAIGLLGYVDSHSFTCRLIGFLHRLASLFDESLLSQLDNITTQMVCFLNITFYLFIQSFFILQNLIYYSVSVGLFSCNSLTEHKHLICLFLWIYRSYELNTWSWTKNTPFDSRTTETRMISCKNYVASHRQLKPSSSDYTIYGTYGGNRNRSQP